MINILGNILRKLLNFIPIKYEYYSVDPKSFEDCLDLSSIEKFQDGINKIIHTLKERDPFSTSREIVERGINWLLLLVGGTFIWFLANFSNFRIQEISSQISYILPYKILFIIACIFLGFATLVFAIIRLGLFFYLIGVTIPIENISKLPLRVRLQTGIISESEQKKWVAGIFARAIELWSNAHSLYQMLFGFFTIGMVCYGLGIVFISIYVVLYVICYL